MKLEKLRIIQGEFKKEFAPEGVDSQVFYFFNGSWHDLNTELQTNVTTTQNLEGARGESVAYHVPASLFAWFYLVEADCCVSLEFSKSPQIGTRRKYRERIAKIQESATNAYRVSHHSLTHLLAKDAFREVLKKELAAIARETTSEIEVQESGLPRTLAVMALDIDYFKQVNDTWGHLYGDQVLKTFGIRLEKVAETIRSTGQGTPSLYIGHPSGEEFLILIVANVNREQFSTWATEFRSVISDEILPSDREWQWLSTRDKISILVPPPVQERTITTSIGVALHTRVSIFETEIELLSALLDRADTALYRAKAAGRNQVIFFDEILASCGRILEQDSNTGVVAIDIGSSVGVSIGQEFKVFPPTFTGQKKFSVFDGRTTRTLGTYPRVESGRLVVFNTQAEISFACIDPPDEGNNKLEVGSHLEAIPAGSIGHLLPHSSRYFPASTDPQRAGGIQPLKDFVASSASGKTGPFAIVVRFAREAEYLRKYGTAALNLALARLYRTAQVEFDAAKAVEVLDKASICIVGTKAAYKEEIVVNFVNEIAAEFPELGILAGVFCDADRISSTKESSGPLDATNAIEFARFAASEFGRSPDSRVRHFGYATARSVLKSLRDSLSFKVAYDDFERLRSLGVESATILNLGGVIAGSLGLRKQALEHYEAAMTKDPKSLIFKSNYATAAYRLGETDSALKVFNALTMTDIDRLKTMHPYGFVVYAKLLANARLSGTAAFDLARFKRIAMEALSLPDSLDSSESKLIKDALAKI